ncbi:MAG: hypothetical protein J3Q66DRAFT_369903 [Benniella sp.]|nr:MAG: hypothetical protein J3Q66DRAFT_369903 [Benniella sp.]
MYHGPRFLNELPRFPPPVYTQLRLLIVNAMVSGEIAMRMVRMNNRLRIIVMYGAPPFRSLHENTPTHLNDDPDFDENIHSPTNPLGHLRYTLEHLTLRSMVMEGMELYYLLRTVAKGNLRVLQIARIQGTFDLRDIVFETLNRLYLWLDDNVQPGIIEIIGRCPQLEHLELSGPHLDGPMCFEQLAHILRGTQYEHTPGEREDRLRACKPSPRQWPHPQLRTLRIDGLHYSEPSEQSEDEYVTRKAENDTRFLELIRALGCICKHGVMVHPSSLRELEIQLWIVDDLARRAIDGSGSTLEVLKIRIPEAQEDTPFRLYERQGWILREILQSCSRLRVMEYWDEKEGSINAIMDAMVGYFADEADRVENVEALVCPELESLTLKAIPTDYWWTNPHVAEERWYFDDGDHGGTNGSSTSPWVMSKQQWDYYLDDGTGYLLDHEVDSTEGDEQLRRFFRHLSPSRKLKECQLGQLRFTRELSITGISVFMPKLWEMATFTHPDGDPSFDENTHSLTNPLGHLRSTLEHVILGSMDFGRMELFYLLRAVASGKLRVLEINYITGTFDLQDITFESLKQLHLWLEEENRHWPYEIIGRSPHLEHLELCGITDISLSYPLDPLVHIMRGSQRQESLKEIEDQLDAEKQEPMQWSRPQLKTLHIQGIHIWKRQEDTTVLGNDPMFLELIQAAGCIYTRNGMTHPCSLQELDIPLWVVDDLSRRAIEASSLTLEVLKIKIQQDLNGLTCWRHEYRGRILREILQSCSKLRTVELWDLNEDKDICVAMAGMIGEYDAIGTVNKGGDDEALVHPRLESFTLKSIPMGYGLHQTHTEGARRYFGDTGDHGVTFPWVMPEQQWDRTLLDGTGFLLDTLWNGFELFEGVVEDLELVNEGDKLLTRFLRCVSPSRKLKDLQLGQLRFTREV